MRQRGAQRLPGRAPMVRVPPHGPSMPDLFIIGFAARYVALQSETPVALLSCGRALNLHWLQLSLFGDGHGGGPTQLCCMFRFRQPTAYMGKGKLMKKVQPL